MMVDCYYCGCDLGLHTGEVESLTPEGKEYNIYHCPNCGKTILADGDYYEQYESQRDRDSEELLRWLFTGLFP